MFLDGTERLVGGAAAKPACRPPVAGPGGGRDQGGPSSIMGRCPGGRRRGGLRLRSFRQ